MAAFPTLRSGAVAQYPLERSVRFRTQAVKFLDGSQQTYRLSGAGLRQWRVRLDLLDDAELSIVIAFGDQQGSGTFAFTDPVTGDIAPKCVLGGDGFEAVVKGENRGAATLLIEEIP